MDADAKQELTQRLAARDRAAHRRTMLSLAADARRALGNMNIRSKTSHSRLGLDWTIALSGPRDAEFFTDSIYATESDAVAAFMGDGYGGADETSVREYVLVEVVSLKRLEKVARPKLTRLNLATISKELANEPITEANDAE